MNEFLYIPHDRIKEFKHIKNCVYMFTSPSGKSYIGLTKNFYKRYNGHKKVSTDKNVVLNTKFYLACKKYGFENFKTYIICKDIDDRELLNFLEVLYIEKYKTQDSKYGYNICPGGEGAQLFGEANGMYGKKHTADARRKMKENCTKSLGELNGWHRSNRTEEELKARGQKAAKSFKENLEKLSTEELKEYKQQKSQKGKEAWENPTPAMQKCLDALRYWEYKTPEELVEIDKKKARKGTDNGRAKIFILESPTGEIFEIELNSNLRKFCEENNLIYRALEVVENKSKVVQYPKSSDTKFYSDENYKYKRLNTIGWKINSYRRKDYEINV